jgi:hypothetical protein
MKRYLYLVGIGLLVSSLSTSPVSGQDLGGLESLVTEVPVETDQEP